MLLSSQRGGALVLVLAFMALTVPIVTGVLGVASTYSIESRNHISSLGSHYANTGGVNDALFQLLYVQYDPANTQGTNGTCSFGTNWWRDTICSTTSTDYTIDLNDETINISVIRLDAPKGDAPSSASALFTEKLQTSKSVNIATTTVSSTVTYTITVNNVFSKPMAVSSIHDGLPSGFSYVALSTNGITTAEPALTFIQDDDFTVDVGQWRLDWDVESLNIKIPAGGSVDLAFDAQVSSFPGTFCNQAWVDPGGVTLTGTGLTAKVAVDVPTGLCPGEGLSITKTVVTQDGVDVITPNDVASSTLTYTVEIQNDTASTTSILRLVEQFPTGFDYKANSISGDFADASRPTASCWDGIPACSALINSNGQSWADWTGNDGPIEIWEFTPAISIPPGASSTIVFQAEPDSAVPAGIFFNDAWGFYGTEFEDRLYTWPTAPLYVMDVFEVRATGDGGSIIWEVWIADDFHFITQRKTD